MPTSIKEAFKEPFDTSIQTAVLILTKNEENSLAQLIDELRAVLKQVPNLRAKLFLCDDSTDQTPKIAKKKGLTVIKGGGRGLGWSYYKALQFLSQIDQFKTIITLDGDGQTCLLEIPVFYKELQKGYDLIVGSRFLKKDSILYNYPKLNFLGVKVLALLLSFATRQKLTDSHGGLRVMRSAVAKNLKFLGFHSYVQETIISAKEQGFQIKELASQWKLRQHGESRVVHSKIKYIKTMSLPLLLRSKAHYILAVIGLALFLLERSFVSLGMIFFSIFIESYKLWLFRKNKKELQKK